MAAGEDWREVKSGVGYSWKFRAPVWGWGAGCSAKLQGATPVPPCPHPPMAPGGKELCPELPVSQGQRAHSAVGLPLHHPPWSGEKGTEQGVLVSIP